MVSISICFSYTFPHPIHQIYATEGGKWMVIILRNPAECSTHLVSLEIIHPTIKSYFMQIPLPWEIGISAIAQDILLLHTYEQTATPQKKTLMAYNLPSYKLLWEKHKVDLISYNEKYIKIKMNVHDTQILYTKTGAIATDTKNESYHDRNKGASNIVPDYPSQYTEQEPYFRICKQFLQRTLDITCIQLCEYLEYKNVIILAFYSKNNNILQHHLAIFDIHSQLFLLHNKMMLNTVNAQQYTFFVINHRLVYIGNSKSIAIYHLG